MGDGCEVAWAGDLGDQGDLIYEERDTGDRKEGGGRGSRCIAARSRDCAWRLLFPVSAEEGDYRNRSTGMRTQEVMGVAGSCRV